MKNIANKLEEIKNQLEIDNASFDQLSNFDTTIKNLEKFLKLEKPSYDFPHIDTIGKQTYNSLNKHNTPST